VGSRPALAKSRTSLGRRKAFATQVYRIVRAIPAGRVMTYGGIAALIPPPAGTNWTGYVRVRARWVGYAMAECPEDVPWQRVVNAQGRISPRPGLSAGVQRALLRQEGVRFNRSGRLDLRLLEWKPSESWLRARGLLQLARASRGQGDGRVP
jgi:methylated-DNA-protein-cysteine methyltransferase-like protein